VTVQNSLALLVHYSCSSTDTDGKGAGRPRKRCAGTILPARTRRSLVCIHKHNLCACWSILTKPGSVVLTKPLCMLMHVIPTRALCMEHLDGSLGGRRGE
jgi:hypothetical protein